MKHLIKRKMFQQQIRAAIARSPIVALLGPRQCGKTTLAREFQTRDSHYFDLESTADRAALEVAPESTLSRLRGMVILDEIQTMPDLFPVLRVLADRRNTPARFLILGSSSPDLLGIVAETLAGRVAFVHVTGFDLVEVGNEFQSQLWERGGFPRSFLAHNDGDSHAWRTDFIDTFLNRDVARFGMGLPPETLRRMWTMLAHVHGGTFNASELARALSIDAKTATRYVDILHGAFLVRRLPPWFENVGKRVVKAPKIYLRDSGLLHTLLGLRTPSEVRTHPRLGYSWEGFALELCIRALRSERDSYFWATHAGAELDLFVIRGGKRIGIEFKYSDAPSTSRSMRVALEDLKLDRLYVVYPGHRRFDLDTRITAVPIGTVADEFSAL